MRSLYFAVFLTSCLLILPVFGFIDVYGHGVSSTQPRYVRIDEEQFSDNTVTTDGVVVITGKIKNIVNRPVALTPYVYVDHNALSPYDNLLAVIYPPLKDQSAWYFRVEENLFKPFNPGSLVLLTAIIANIVAAVLISILALKERSEPAQIMR